MKNTRTLNVYNDLSGQAFEIKLGEVVAASVTTVAPTLPGAATACVSVPLPHIECSLTFCDGLFLLIPFRDVYTCVPLVLESIVIQ